MNTTYEMKVRDDYFSVSGSKSIANVKMEAKVRRTFDDTGKPVLNEKLDSVRFVIAGNWGNRIYMTRATGNKLYRAFVHGKIKADYPAALLRAATEYLDSISAEYRIGFELTANVPLSKSV